MKTKLKNSDDFFRSVGGKNTFCFLKMPVIGRYGLAFIEIGGNGMWLVGEVVQAKQRPVPQTLFPGQQPGKFDFIVHEAG